MKTEGEIEEIWYHVDVNSAFLSWTAAHEIHIKGSGLDLRTIPSAIGGNEKERHGIVLANQDLLKSTESVQGNPFMRQGASVRSW